MSYRLTGVIVLAMVVVTTPFLAQEAVEADSNRLWAIVIGVSNYAHAEPLRFAASDADAFSEFLQSPRGGGIPEDHIFTLLEDQATRFGVLVALEELQGKVQTGDTVYVYLAGHGFIKNRVGYFIPSDGALSLPAASAVNFAHLKSMVEAGLAHANTRILVTDMCNAGRIGPQQTELASRIQNLLNEELLGIDAGGGTFLNLLASRPTEASWERDDLGSGVFTYALLEALNGQGAVPGSTVASAQGVVDYVRSEVPKYTANQQNPMSNDDFEPGLILSYLNLPGPIPRISADTTRLIIVGAAALGYLRVEWLDPRTDSQAVQQVAGEDDDIEIVELQPGELELRLYDAENRERTFTVMIEEGSNTLRIDALGSSFQPAPVLLTASLAPVVPKPPQALPASGSRAALLIRLDNPSDVYLDGAYFGNSDTGGQLFQLRGLNPGVHNLRLVPSPDREYRFRLELFAGSHVFDLASGEIRFVAAKPLSPSQAAVPVGVPAGLAGTYQDFERALWSDDLIEPEGQSAWDYYNQLQGGLPADIATDIRNRLVVAMGNRAQRTILKYRRGGDIRWSTEIFEEGALLTDRVRGLFQTTQEMESQQRFFDGRALIENGQYAAAVQQLEQAIALDAQASHAHNAIGLAYWQQGLFDVAIPPLQQAIALTPEWNYPRYTLSLVYLEQRRYDETELGFQAALANDDEDSTAYHGLGQLYLLLGRNEEAEAQLERAVEFNPGNAYAYHTYGKLRQRTGQLVDAEDMFRLAIRLEPDETSFRASLGDLLVQAGRGDEADPVFAVIAAADPASIPVVEMYSRFLTSEGRNDEADRLFERAIEVAPDDANLRVLYGTFLRRENRIDDAEDEYRRAIELDSANAFAHHNLASLHLALENLDDAEQGLERAIEADPRYAAPQRLRGQIRFAQERYTEALVDYETAFELTIELDQRLELAELITATRGAIVGEGLDSAAGAIERGRYGEAWSSYVEAARTAPDDMALRNAILRFNDEFASDADLTALPPSNLADVVVTRFWGLRRQAEEAWRSGGGISAIGAFFEAIDTLEGAELALVTGTEFNLGNDVHGIHQIVYDWALRSVESGEYTGALGLMDRAVELNIFGIVPDFSPLTIDSLMYPEDALDPREFADFEIAYHPDRRVHEIYAAATVVGDTDGVGIYLEALEGAGPDVGARMLLARTLRNEERPEEAIGFLDDVVAGQDRVRDREQLPGAYVLLAEMQCETGDCAGGIETLESGLQLFPDDEGISDALRRMRQGAR